MIFQAIFFVSSRKVIPVLVATMFGFVVRRWSQRLQVCIQRTFTHDSGRELLSERMVKALPIYALKHFGGRPENHESNDVCHNTC